MEMSKEQFLKEFSNYYGYPDGPKNIEEIRATEFKRLANGSVYLDHAGATLYSELQMEAIFKDLTSNVYGNPHSQSDSSMDTSDIIRGCRQLVLDYCNASAKEYKCIFTSGATAALKMVGEAFPWSSQSHFIYTMENHNSVIGIREYALNHGAAAVAVDVEELLDQDTSSADKKILFKASQHTVQRRNGNSSMKEDAVGNACHLFAFPSECNFSGVRFNLDLIGSVKNHSQDIFKNLNSTKGCWFVLIDAAKGCATEPPDLSKYPADFVVLSFYKIFGYPTGLGALVVRNEAAKLLKKTYFSGGTVAASIADVDFVKHRDGVEESFEDGTASFLSIASIRHGFRIMNTLTISSVSRHTSSLTTYLKRVLSSLKHNNGAHVCIIYGDNKISVTKGSMVSFNLKRPDGSWIGYREVEKLASLSGIQLRTGCFCNPGACAKYLGLSHLELMSNVEAGHICWDDFDVVNGKPTGAVRVSFGYMSTFEEAKKLVDFIVSSFVVLPTPVKISCLLPDSDMLLNKGSEGMQKTTGLYLKSITVYPIKSCAGFSVDSWSLSKTGLIHDREWLLRSPSGEILTQKKVPQMSLISTFIDLNQGVLFVESPHCKTKLQILLRSASTCCGREELELHGHRYEVQYYNQEVNSWFSNAIERPCILWRFSASNTSLYKKESAGTCRDLESPLSFVNEAQFLLVSETSIMDLNNRLRSSM